MERLTISAGFFGDEELFALRDSQRYKFMYYDKCEEKSKYNVQLIINSLGLVEDELEIYKKALELACESLAVCYNRENIEYGVDAEIYNRFSLFNDFIETAKENMENE